MKSIITPCLLIFYLWGCASAVEETQYRLISKTNNFEIREYPTYIVAETDVDGKLEDAGNKAFKKLFGYISGKNRSREKIAMTAPVKQKLSSEKIAMTAPVKQLQTEGGWIVSFTMPNGYTMETLPTPENPDVRLRQLESHRVASVQYSGTWSEERYLKYLQELESWIEENGLIILGEPIWARYNPPFTPWFLRRNEILIPVDSE